VGLKKQFSGESELQNLKFIELFNNLLTK